MEKTKLFDNNIKIKIIKTYSKNQTIRRQAGVDEIIWGIGRLK